MHEKKGAGAVLERLINRLAGRGLLDSPSFDLALRSTDAEVRRGLGSPGWRTVGQQRSTVALLETPECPSIERANGWLFVTICTAEIRSG
jgi:hypothetical protein